MNITLLQGRLGNQLFEYAFARSLSLALGQKCVLSEAPLRAKNISNRLDCFVLSPDIEFVMNHKLTFSQRLALSFYSRHIEGKSRMQKYALEQKYRNILSLGGVFVCENGYITPPKCKGRNMINVGYFQSEKYFGDYKDTILEELQFKDSVKDSVKEIADNIKKSVEPTCLHIRLGDYVKNPLHGVADAAYYRRALAELKNRKPNATIFLFSDNVELVKSELALDDMVIYIPSDIDDQQTMYLGSLCHNFVISNSSFSWWMQYLSRYKEKLVIAPSRWYAKLCPCDIYMKDWIIVDV